MKAGVVRFPGSCDEVDAQQALSRVGDAVLLWHADRDLQGVDAVVVNHREMRRPDFALGRCAPPARRQEGADVSAMVRLNE